MQRKAMVIGIKPDRIDEYKKYHAEYNCMMNPKIIEKYIKNC